MKIDLRSIILAGAAMMADLMPSARAQYSVKRWEYTLADTAGNWSMPEDKKEHHCILYDTKKQRISVVGTYGNFGYFEGSFKMGTNDASVTWWDTTITDSVMAPASGSAWLTYTDTMNNGTQISTVTGGYSQNVPSPRYDLWLATDGSLKEDSSVDETAHEAFMEFCLLTKPRSKTWSDIMGTVATKSQFSNPPVETQYMMQLHATVWVGKQGSSRYCVNRYNLKSEYSYKYSKEEADFYMQQGIMMEPNDIERGHYGDDAIVYFSSFGEGVCVCARARVCVCVYVIMCVWVCVYVHICTYIYIYIVYIYIYCK